VRALHGAYRHRPVEETVEEIAALPGKGFLFADDNLLSDDDASRALLEALPRTGKRFGAQVSIDAVAAEGAIDRLARAGCAAVLLGLESLDPASLGEMRKGWNLSGPPYGEVVERLRARGLLVYGTFLFGYDHDGPEAFEAALDFALRHRLFIANFNPLSPTPGTPLYARLRAEGRLPGDPWWLDPAYRYGDAQLVPARLSPEALRDGVLDLRRRFYGLASIARRATDRRANTRTLGNAALFLAANLLSRREIARKQGRALGGG
jgi:radical SAM superfamily enzyme YgiQ (UPF0313 family)